MTRNSALQGLINQGRIWPARRQHGRAPGHDRCSSGLSEVDQLLGGGWPDHGLIELLLDRPGLGESQLLRSLWQERQAHGYWHACIAPPCIPYAPALQASGLDPSRWLLIQPRHDSDVLWSAEHCLRSESCASVLAWPEKASLPSLRRLQLLAEEHRVPVVLFRPTQEAAQGSPAVLRLRLSTAGKHTAIEVIKCRGGSLRRTVNIDLFTRHKPLPFTTPYSASVTQTAWARPGLSDAASRTATLRH